MAAPFVMWFHHFILAFLVIPNPKGDEVAYGFFGQGSVLVPSVHSSLLTVYAVGLPSFFLHFSPMSNKITRKQCSIFAILLWFVANKSKGNFVLVLQKRILFTGVAGFIGFHLSKRLLDDGFAVTGMDNMNDYYDPALKEARLAILQEYKGFNFTRLDLADTEGMEALFGESKPGIVVHLAAQAGVRYSVENPHVYIKSNIDGFLNVLEGCRHHKVEHLVFASSSSVYGLNTKMPFSEKDHTDHPVSLYGATKKANEMMAHSYSHLYGIPTTGLRFFTVYGPWGRPDMAYFSFTKAILEGKSIRLFNFGKMKRDFTYVEDIVEGMVRIMSKPAKPNQSWSGGIPDPSSSSAPYRIYNIGNNNPVELGRFVEILEERLGRKAIIEFFPLQQGDVVETFADIDSLFGAVGFRPKTSLEEGLGEFVEWYETLYGKMPKTS